METNMEFCGFRTFPKRPRQGITIESPNGPLLNKMVTEMSSKNFDLRTIDSYVNSMETFLELIDDPTSDAIGKVISPSSLTTLRFFFRQVLKPNFPQYPEGTF